MIITFNKDVKLQYDNMDAKNWTCYYFDVRRDAWFIKFKNFCNSYIKNQLWNSLELVSEYIEDLEMDFFLKLFKKLNKNDYKKQEYIKKYLLEIFNEYKNKNWFYNKNEYIENFNVNEDILNDWIDENENRKIILPFEAENIKEYWYSFTYSWTKDILMFLNKFNLDQNELKIVEEILSWEKRWFWKWKEKKLKEKLTWIMTTYKNEIQ